MRRAWVVLVILAVLTLVLAPSGTPALPEVQTRTRLIGGAR